jgi:hypothetical protein
MVAGPGRREPARKQKLNREDVKVMEQYVHTLIAANSAFVPESPRVALFFDLLITSFNFRVISDAPFQQGLRVMKPSGRFRSFISPFTREKEQFPISDHIKVEKITDIPLVIEGLEHYSVLQSGEWKTQNRPLVLLTTDGVPYEESYVCEGSCHLRPEPVSTSCWDIEASADQLVPAFGKPCEGDGEAGVFSHPWTHERIEVPNAGCARFWIEFEFGKFLLPKMANSLDVLSPLIVAKTEECFHTKFVQGCRFN